MGSSSMRGGSIVLIVGVLSVTLVTSQTCDVRRIFKCLLPFNGTYPIVRDLPPRNLERVCRQQGIPTDDCLTSFRFECDLQGRVFVDNVLHALSDMCSINTLQEYRTFSPCLSTKDTQTGLRQCQITRHPTVDHCRIVEEIVQCERDVVQAQCGSEVGAWYVLWSLQARTTLDAASTHCQINLSTQNVIPIGVSDMIGPVAIVLIVTGVALFVLGLFVCGLYLCACYRKEPHEETDVLHMRQPACSTPHRTLQLY